MSYLGPNGSWSAGPLGVPCGSCVFVVQEYCYFKVPTERGDVRFLRVIPNFDGDIANPKMMFFFGIIQRYTLGIENISILVLMIFLILLGILLVLNIIIQRFS